MAHPNEVYADFERLLDNLPGMVYRCRADAEWTMDFISAGAQTLLGHPPEPGRWTRRGTFHSWTAADQRESVLAQVKAALEQRTAFDVTYSIKKAGGDFVWIWERGQGIWNESGDLVALEGFLTDITEQKQAEEMIAYLAYYDGLTGLPNRLFFMERLARAIMEAGDQEERMALVFLNLNRFALIQKSLGHLAGDQLVKSMAVRLEESLVSGSLLCRMATDEFLILLRDVGQPSRARQEAQRIIRDVFTHSYVVDGREVYLSVTAGISVFPEHGLDVESLIRNSDLAMKRAQQDGIQFHVYADTFGDRGVERLALETALRKAAERGEIRVLYQPKVNLVSGRIAGVEALSRWAHAEFGEIAPSDFIPLAEEVGLIGRLGDHILEQSVLQNRRWQAAGLPSVPIAVNISARQFADENLAQKIVRLLEEAELEPRYLELEVTESCLMHNPEDGIATLRTLKDIGIAISIDDFGTGYSSLSYLKRFPVDALKIDRSFIRDMTESPDSASIVRAIINLAHIMGLKVVAEGVETLPQLRFLRDCRCDEIQGYLFSRALPALELENHWDRPLIA